MPLGDLNPSSHQSLKDITAKWCLQASHGTKAFHRYSRRPGLDGTSRSLPGPRVPRPRFEQHHFEASDGGATEYSPRTNKSVNNGETTGSGWIRTSGAPPLRCLALERSSSDVHKLRKPLRALEEGIRSDVRIVGLLQRSLRIPIGTHWCRGSSVTCRHAPTRPKRTCRHGLHLLPPRPRPRPLTDH